MIECKHPKTVFVKLSRKDVSFVDMTAGEGLNSSQGSLGRTSLTRLSLAKACPSLSAQPKRGEFGFVVGLILRAVLSMVREPHHDKKLY